MLAHSVVGCCAALLNKLQTELTQVRREAAAQLHTVTEAAYVDQTRAVAHEQKTEQDKAHQSLEELRAELQTHAQLQLDDLKELHAAAQAR